MSKVEHNRSQYKLTVRTRLHLHQRLAAWRLRAHAHLASAAWVCGREATSTPCCGSESRGMDSWQAPEKGPGPPAALFPAMSKLEDSMRSMSCRE
jgi:hypothetical protein